MKKIMLDGIIEPFKDNVFGFVPDFFDGWLWKTGGDIYISFMESRFPCNGNFKKLIRTILSMGFNIKIPTPLGRMDKIVRKNKYKHTVEKMGEMEKVDVWIKRSRSKSNGVAIG